MKTTEQYNELLLIMTEEKNILSSIVNMNQTDRKKANNRLFEIIEFKKAFFPLEIACVEELLKPKANENVFIEYCEKQKFLLKKKRKALQRIEQYEDKININDEDEFNFLSWIITVMITNKTIFIGDFEATMIYEIVKSLVKEDKPKYRY